jgi:hypothetical protein
MDPKVSLCHPPFIDASKHSANPLGRSWWAPLLLYPSIDDISCYRASDEAPLFCQFAHLFNNLQTLFSTGFGGVESVATLLQLALHPG